MPFKVIPSKKAKGKFDVENADTNEVKNKDPYDTESEAQKYSDALNANSEKVDKSTTLLKFAQLTKIDAIKGEVWGRMATETPDDIGEICDYEHSKPNFLLWSEKIQKVSGGKSLGNVRTMHNGQLEAVGKLIHFEARDDTKDFYVGAKIVDKQALEKVSQEVYTAFSIGGKYGAWHQLDGLHKRYEAVPVEVSLVDNPSIPDATFEMIKEDGVVELRKFTSVKKEEPMTINFPPLAKASLQDKIEAIRSAFYAKFNPKENVIAANSGYVTDVLDDGVVVQKDGDLLKYSYAIGTDGAITFGEPIRVERNYTIVSTEVGKATQPLDLSKVSGTPTATDNGGAATEPEPAASGKAAEAPSRDDIRAIILGILEELGLVVKEGDTMKAAQAQDLTKSAEALDLVKADFVKKGDELSKSIEDGDKALAKDIAQLVIENETLSKRVDSVTGMGPVVQIPNGDATYQASQEVEMLKKYQLSAKTPQEVEQFGKLIADAEIRQIQKTKGQ
jgi:hypothetical protein